MFGTINYGHTNQASRAQKRKPVVSRGNRSEDAIYVLYRQSHAGERDRENYSGFITSFLISSHGLLNILVPTHAGEEACGFLS